MRTITLLLALLAALFVGPATAQAVGPRSLNALDSAPKKFVLVKAQGQDPAQLERYARAVRDELNAKDWKEAAFVAADVAIFVDYRIAAPRREVSRTEVPESANAVGGAAGGRTAGLMTVGLESAAAEPGAAATFAPPPEAGHERSVHIEMFAAKPFMRNMRLAPVYDMTVSSSGSAEAVDAAMPDLVKAALAPIAGGRRTGSEVRQVQ